MRAWLRSLREMPLLFAGLGIVAALIVLGLIGPWLAPYGAEDITGPSFESPSWSHLLGTDDAGHDNFSRLLVGTRNSMLVAVVSTALIMVIGLAVGLTAGLRRGFVDTALMRIVDILLALPALPLLILIAALAGPSLTLSIILIAFAVWPQTARIVRSQTLSLRTRGYVEMAQGFGAGPVYTMRRHLAPALGPILGANLAYVAGLAIVIEAGLAFLGLGDPTAVSWGADIQRALDDRVITYGGRWVWLLLPPGVALTLAIFGLTLIGVGLEPRFNPRWDFAR